MREVISKIEQTDDCEISLIIAAIIGRYKAVFPDWEVLFLSLPKQDPGKREAILKSTFDYLKNHIE